MAYIDSANIKGTLYELQDTAARGSIAAVETATDARFDDLETYVRDMSPVAYGNDEGIPAPVAMTKDAAPLNAEDVFFEVEPVQEGSGDPSPDNVRPITGCTGAEVYRTGKNLLDTSGWIVKSGATNIYLTLPPNTEYTMSADVPNGSVAGGGLLYVMNSTGTPSYNVNAVYSGKSITVETNNDGVVRVVFYGRDFITDWSDWQIQLELGSTATAYEPYQGDTFDITFPSEAGTVYGGMVDLTRGKLVVDRGYIASYDGETLPGEWISSMDVYTPGGTPTTGAQVVYTLASAVEHNLTPQEIEMLKGVNTLWANTGDISVQYRQDIYTALNNKINALKALVLENLN